MTERWTVLSVLRWTAEYLKEKGIDSPRLDAELLIGDALNKDRVGLYLCYDQPLQPEELTKIRQLVARRAKREPLQYIVGHTEFWSLPFKVAPGVLIPRGDTEILVEEALRLLEDTTISQQPVLDVGTGSGAIAVAMAHSCPELQVEAVDLQPEALVQAQANAERNGVADRVCFRQQDMAALSGGPYRLVVSNPPYIREDEMDGLMPEVRDHEPAVALQAGSDGLDCYRLLCEQALNLLTPGGWLLVEVGAGQADDVAALMVRHGLSETFQREDYNGIVRVVGGQAPVRTDEES
ncbi:peptide chain release factor N(5)-glutamine methyltransferase [uncultured Desulfuromonas sp.]|uniref:peptide chain release factor N(5)-glutamine methyltransferase n=1 Tax=uncultured Desulfuromonas sp. TaxID=181013 RepID=UPI002AAC1E8E|nr:peptide chain release factor N(5)-glutamine methyltransferase [uncultured Desulfuromonas sp.]